MPIEVASDSGWMNRVAATLVQLVRAPNASFRSVQEPVSHLPVLLLLITVRFPIWLVLVGLWTFQVSTSGDRSWVGATSLGGLIEPNFSQPASIWMMFMIPVGIPLFYLLGGVLGHGAIAVTGGAQRSLAASMRSFGYTAAVPFLVIGLLDIPLYLHWISAEVYVVSVGALLVYFYLAGSLAIARTHSIRLVRGFMVGVVPVVFVGVVVLGRATLELPNIPFAKKPTVGGTFPPFEYK